MLFYIRILGYVLVLSLFSQISQASIIKAVDLQKICHNLNQSQLGANEKFDPQDAGKCSGYISGFADSMFIIEQMTNTKTFCVPSYVSVENNTAILDTWIAANPKIALDANASVALLSAYQKAFPCPKDKK